MDLREEHLANRTPGQEHQFWEQFERDMWCALHDRPARKRSSRTCRDAPAMGRGRSRWPGKNMLWSNSATGVDRYRVPDGRP